MLTRRNFSVPTKVRSGTFLFLTLALALSPFFSVRAGIAGHLVINELRIEGDAGSYDDWVELYNPTGSDIDLSGWSLQKFSSTGASYYVQSLAGTIPAGGYFLVVRNSANTTQSLKDMADLLADDSFSIAANNIIYLSDSSDTIDPAAPGGDVVDHVGFGDADYYEGAAAAPGVSTGKSLSRSPDGEDTDENSVDLILLDTPTPENSGQGSGNDDLIGTVLVTITPDAVPVQSITPEGASLVFRVNADGKAVVEYGPDDAYGSSSAETAVFANTDIIIDINSLACGTTYNYMINAENSDSSDSDSTDDATFTTMPCGITVDSLVMTRSGARANGDYAEGWEWQFEITVWEMAETGLKMKFGPWNGAAALSAGSNMRYSTDGGSTWKDIAADDTYPASGADISGIDNSTDSGRQVSILVRMKVPRGTLAGEYGTSYGILTE